MDCGFVSTTMFVSCCGPVQNNVKSHGVGLDSISSTFLGQRFLPGVAFNLRGSCFLSYQVIV